MLIFREEAVEFCVDLFCDVFEVGIVGFELQLIAVHNEQFPGIILYPGFVALIQAS